MDTQPKNEQDLISPDVMGSFFASPGSIPGYESAKLVRIIPRKGMSGNLIVAYELQVLLGGKTVPLKVWGKSMDKKNYLLLEFFLSSGAGIYLPHYFRYLEEAGFGLYIDIGGVPLEEFEDKIGFWRENTGKVAELIAGLQKPVMPSDLINIRTPEVELQYVASALEKIDKYSAEEGARYRKYTHPYTEYLRDEYKEKDIVFNHFDIQQRNIYFEAETGSMRLLDFDLAAQFHYALDPCNFIAHIYVMLRYHFSREEVLEIVKIFTDAYVTYRPETERLRAVREMEIFKAGGMIRVAGMTADIFRQPSPDSEKVFAILRELVEKYPDPN